MRFLLILSTSLLCALSSPAATVYWNWAGGDRNWSTPANWVDGVPEPANAIIFGPADAQAAVTPPNNIVDTSSTILSLAYTNSSLGAYNSFHNTALAAGQTLTITSGLRVGVGSAAVYAVSPYTYASITGADATVEVTVGPVQIGHQSSTASGLQNIFALLDLRGLRTFIYNDPTANFSISGGAQRRQGGELFLAGSNHIVAPSIPIGNSQPGLGAGSGRLHLGERNTIFSDSIAVGRITVGNLLDFQEGLVNPIATVRGVDGVNGVADWNVGWNNQGNQNSSNSSGTNDFSNGTLDAIVTNLNVGYFSAGIATGTRWARGYFTLGNSANNSLVVENLTIGNVALATASSSSSAVGVFEANGGNIKAGTVTLAQQLGSGIATGTLTLNNTIMEVEADLVDGNGASTISISASTLKVGGRIGAPTTAGIIETLNLSNATLGLTLVAPGDYTKATISAGTLNIDGANNSTVITINNVGPAPGQYPLIAYTGLTGASGYNGLRVQAPLGATAVLSNNMSSFPFTIDVIITAEQLVWNGVPNGNWDIGTTQNWLRNGVAAFYTENGGFGDRVLFNDSAAGVTTVNLTTTLSPLGATVTNVNKDYTFTGTGKLSGSGGLIKQGSGTLTLAQSGDNDYTGTTYVAGGKLRIGSGGTDGMVGPGPLTVDGTVEFNRSDDLTVSNTISGLGGLAKLGANTVKLAGSASYAGPTTIAGGTLEFSPSGTDLVSGNITGAGRLVMSGTGTLVLTDPANAYSGGTVIASGTIQLGDGVSPGSLSGNVINDGTLLFNGGFYNFNNNITGAGGVVSIGPSAYLTLAGNNSYAGPTTIRNGGTLQLGASTGMSPHSALILGEPGGPSIGAADFTGYNVVIGGLQAGGNQATANTLTLGSGQTLTVNGSMFVGNTGSGGARANLTVNGNGATLNLNTNGGLIQIGMSTTGNGTGANVINCDLSALDVFTANLGATGAIRLGETNLNTANNTPLQVLRLSPTSRLTAGLLSIGSGGKGLTPELHLGSLTNLLNVDLIRLGLGEGAGRDSGNLLFGGPTGSLRVRGSGGAATRANLHVLVGDVGTAFASANLFDLAGHYADVLVDSLIIGDQPNRQGTWSNYFAFDQGTLDALSVSLGTACRAGTTGSSVLRLGGGTANFGSLAMAGNNATALLDIANAQVTIAGDLQTAGSGNGTLQVANASLVVKGRIASAAQPLTTVTLDNTTLSVGRTAGLGNPTSPLVNASALTLSGNCPLILTGTNYVVGQFPLIRYSGTIGGSGFAAITSFTPPPGVSATLVNNALNQSIDVNITAAPPVGAQATVGFSVTGDQLNLSWLDAGMILQTNAVSIDNPAAWFPYPGSTLVTNLNLTIDSGTSNVFFRLAYP